MGSKEEEARRIQLLHRHDRDGERDGKKASIFRFVRLNADARPSVMEMADSRPAYDAPQNWDDDIRTMYHHVQEQAWGDDPPNLGVCLLLAELLNWAAHLEQVRADTQTQLNNYEAAALRDQTKGLLDA